MVCFKVKGPAGVGGDRPRNSAGEAVADIEETIEQELLEKLRNKLFVCAFRSELGTQRIPKGV
jgi:hypothetical protein